MKKIIIALLFINALGAIQAQNTFNAILKNEDIKEPVIFANAYF